MKVIRISALLQICISAKTSIFEELANFKRFSNEINTKIRTLDSENWEGGFTASCGFMDLRRRTT